MSLKIIECNDEQWGRTLGKSSQFDFYHTACYHQLETTGLGKLIVISEGPDFIAFPLIIRSIPNTTWYDATSVYGYAGPISNRPFNEISEKLIKKFHFEFSQYCIQNNIITVFSRLHPLMSSEIIFEHFGSIKKIHETVSIDVTLPLEDQWRQYRKSNKSEINQLRGKKGYQVIEAKSKEEIKIFAEIYLDTMSRVKAGGNYFFDIHYFEKFLTADCYDSKLLLAVKDSKIAAGAIFTIADDIMQYHLAGTSEEFMRDTPMKLLIDEARIYATSIGLKYFHLGGGVGSSEQDSLFKFKSGFSEKRYFYNAWKYVSNEEMYINVCEQIIGKMDIEIDYFPKYRMPQLIF